MGLGSQRDLQLVLESRSSGKRLAEPPEHDLGVVDLLQEFGVSLQMLFGMGSERRSAS
jgi:hypothetical protein